MQSLLPPVLTVLRAFLCLVFLSAAFGGAWADGPGLPQEPVELVIWGLPEKPPSHAPGAGNLALFELFLDTHPEIHVKRGGGPQLQRFGRGTREFLMAQAGGIAPDVVEMSDVDLQDFTTRNFLYPLDEYLEEVGLLEEFRSNPFARQFMRNGKIYALPNLPKLRSFALVYRKDAFQRIGLDPEKPPTTWDEILRCAELLTDPPNDYTGFVIPSLETKGPLGAGGFVELLFALNGVEVIRKLPDGRWSADFADAPGAIQAVDFLKDLIGRRIVRDGKGYRGIGATSAGRVDDAIMYAFGNAAMIIQTMEELPWHTNRGLPMKDIGVGLVPLGPAGDGYVPLYTRYFGVNSTSPTEARRRAAFQWILFNQRKENLPLFAKAYMDWGWSAFIDPRDVQGDPELAGIVREIPEQWRKVYESGTRFAKALPLCEEHRRLRTDYLARPLWELLKNPDLDAKKLLHETEDLINKEVFVRLPAEVRTARRRIAFVVVALVALAITVAAVIGLREMAKSLAADRGRGTVFQAGRRQIYFLAALFMIPAVASVVLWMYLPLIRGAAIAFQDYQIVGDVKWVGLDNFIAVLTDKLFWIALLRTVEYGAISLSLGFVAPIVLAFLLAEVPRGKILFRILFYLPALTSALVIMYLWCWIYNPTPQGLLNTIFAAVGRFIGVELGPYKWLDSDRLAMISVILPSIWAGIGPGSIIYLAALHGIPEDTYEAADIDGATAWGKVWNVSIPFLKPLIIINFVGAFIGTFQAMQNIFVMTQGGPGNATYVVGLYIFFNSFVWLQFGKATAAAWILGSLLIGFTVYQLKILRQLKFSAAATTEE
ncbi:MAG: extracellular solute-binding protein [Planctomycetota bacterium]